MMKSIINKLQSIRYKENVSFKTLTSFKTGGNASLVVYPSNNDELIYLIDLLKSNNIKYAVFGNGTNILASDEDYDGVIIKLDDYKIYEKNENEIHVSSGYSLAKLCFDLSKESYKGFTFGANIPGTIGGAIFMNAGAYGGEIKDVLKKAFVYYNGEILELSNEDLKFGKRYSIIQEMKEAIVLSGVFNLEKTEEDLMEEIKINSEKRKSSQPLEYPNAGSVFKNPIDIPAGKLIEELGLKGYGQGGAEVSLKHGNFIINKGNATSQDIINIIDLIKSKALNERNIHLELEIQLFNFK